MPWLALGKRKCRLAYSELGVKILHASCLP
jgi:hypothetical protein